jgi:hypothetical protein
MLGLICCRTLVLSSKLVLNASLLQPGARSMGHMGRKRLALSTGLCKLMCGLWYVIWLSLDYNTRVHTIFMRPGAWSMGAKLDAEN